MTVRTEEAPRRQKCTLGAENVRHYILTVTLRLSLSLRLLSHGGERCLMSGLGARKRALHRLQQPSKRKEHSAQEAGWRFLAQTHGTLGDAGIHFCRSCCSHLLLLRNRLPWTFLTFTPDKENKSITDGKEKLTSTTRCISSFPIKME